MSPSWSRAAKTGAARIARQVSEVKVKAKPPAKARHCAGGATERVWENEN